jgi:tetratricopeptide (TPR) repeat protein
MSSLKKNENFIDKTFTIIANILLEVFPASKKEKEAFSYYKNGLSAHTMGNYAEALENYYAALQIEEDFYDCSYIFYNVGLIYSSNGNYIKALRYYNQALFLNPRLSQALNNVAVIYHYQGMKAVEQNLKKKAFVFFEQAKLYWRQAIKLAPNNYIEAQNWLNQNI